MRCFLLLLFVILATPLLAQIPPSEVLNEPIRKIQAQQYYSGYRALEDDYGKDSTGLRLAQAEYLLRYFSKTVAHQYFGLKDVRGAKQELQALRAEGVHDGQLIFFPVDSMLLPILQKTPQNKRMQQQQNTAHFLLGWYYYQVHSYFPRRWLLNEEQVLGLMYRHFQQYLQQPEQGSAFGLLDFLEKAYDGIGYYELKQKNYNAAKEAFEKRLQAEPLKQIPQAPSVYYNLAYCHLELGSPEQGIPQIHRAIEQYQRAEDPRQVETYRLAALLYGKAEQWKAAEKYWLRWGKAKGDERASWIKLLDNYLSAKQIDEADRWAERIWQQDSVAPNTYETLIDHYGAATQLSAFIVFLQSKSSTASQNPEVLGALHFFSADASLILGEKEAAKTYLIKAKEAFNQLYDKRKAQQLNKVIEQVLRDL